jgi:2-oxoglutarate ferredoxin oxidoreductase subunit beta
VDRIDFVPEAEEITVEYGEGTAVDVAMHDGSLLRLFKVDGSHDPRSADEALATIRRKAAVGEVATGLLFVNEEQQDLHDVLNTSSRPLTDIPFRELCPGSKALVKINAALR